MSVYHKVTPNELSTCLRSLSAQSSIPDQFVIVRDGPLSTELDQLLTDFSEQLSPRVKLVSLDTNQGLIKALNEGLTHCTGDWILRMDADDVAVADRVKVQMEYIEQHPEVDVLGSSMLEFEDDPANLLRKKSAPVTHEAIKKQMPYRNPVNHPTVCIRKSCLKAVGGYPALQFLEDYFLWAQLLHRGAIFHNLEQPLHLYRFDAKTLDRRAGKVNFENECSLRWWMFHQGMMTALTLITVVGLQVILRFAPFPLREKLWHLTRQKLNQD